MGFSCAPVSLEDAPMFLSPLSSHAPPTPLSLSVLSSPAPFLRLPSSEEAGRYKSQAEDVSPRTQGPPGPLAGRREIKGKRLWVPSARGPGSRGQDWAERERAASQPTHLIQSQSPSLCNLRAVSGAHFPCEGVGRG